MLCAEAPAAEAPAMAAVEAFRFADMATVVLTEAQPLEVSARRFTCPCVCHHGPHPSGKKQEEQQNCSGKELHIEREREKREKVGGDGGAADDPVLGFRKFELVRVVGGEWGSRGTDGTGR